jgi:hypothetical protein
MMYSHANTQAHGGVSLGGGLGSLLPHPPKAFFIITEYTEDYSKINSKTCFGHLWSLAETIL